MFYIPDILLVVKNSNRGILGKTWQGKIKSSENEKINFMSRIVSPNLFC